MLKKMRWRFIGAAMVAFTTVVLALLCCINIWNYRNMTARLDNTLAVLYEIGENGLVLAPQQEKPPQDQAAPFPGEIPYMIRFFSVQYGENGKLLNINQDYIASISQEEALRFAGHVLETGRERGFHDVYRFLVNTADGKATVIFLNAENELLVARDLLATTLGVSGLCLGVVFLLVLLLAGRTVKPYMRNLEMQRQFITNAGHELKTPLTAISTSADVLAMEYEDDEWVRNIQLQSSRLSKLITNLIALSRLDEGTAVSGKERVFAQRCVVGNRGFLSAAAAGKRQILFPEHRRRPDRHRRLRRRAANGKHPAGQRCEIFPA